MRQSIFSNLILLIVVVLPLIAGILLIVFSRKRGGPGHAACGQCGYNVVASIESGSRCPECGAAFAEVGITPPQGGGRRNTAMLIAGVMLIVLAVGCVGSSLLMYGARSASRAVAPSATAAPGPAPAPTTASP